MTQLKRRDVLKMGAVLGGSLVNRANDDTTRNRMKVTLTLAALLIAGSASTAYAENRDLTEQKDTTQ